MKKYITDIKTLAALLMAGTAFTACSDKDEMIGEQPVNPVTKYTMTVNASMGDDGTTRALALDGKALKVKWAGTDQVAVFPEDWSSTLGTLTAAASETGSTTLSGDLTGTVNVGDNLNLLFPRAEWNYTGQKGILLSDENSIEKKYDYALADVTVAEIDNSHITTTANANLASQQAIVKFILKDKNGDALATENLTISAASNKLVTKKGYRGTGEKSYYYGDGYYTVDGGSGGYNTNEEHNSLVDNDLDTKWCQSKPDGGWWIEFHTASAILVDGYMLRTGGDTSGNSGRNPTDWVLKGKNAGDSDWTTIDAKSNNNDMPAEDNASRDFDVDAPGEYQYFRLEISNNRGNGGAMQLSEMQLFKYNSHEMGTSYGDITVTPAAATASEYTVALRNENAGVDTYTLTATVGEDIYTFERNGVTFQNGKYYNITVKMERQTTIDLSTVTTDITVPDGFTLTGTLDGAHKISIADGATVTLDGVTIVGEHSEWYQYAGITCLGDATIILKDGTTNTVNGNDSGYPGIQGAASKTLTIQGTGTLIASSDGNGAGIGSAKYETCGNIVISGGTITAVGGKYRGAGIGSGYYGGCGTITISGGTITATGGREGAGIGSGNEGNCGDITITSGVISVTATKGSDAPNSIGAGLDATCGTVKFGTQTMYDGSSWTTPPTSGSTYDGLSLVISTTGSDNDTWTLTPVLP